MRGSGEERAQDGAGAPVRLAMWSGPRNLSTAMMRAWENRPDTVVVDEPLYGYYLAHTGLDHPGRNEVLEAMETDPRRVIDTVFAADGDRPIRFTKNMAHHLVDLDFGFLDTLANVLLTRHPAGVLPSLQANVPDAGVEATGLPMQMAILDRIEAAGDDPVVLVDDVLFTGRTVKAALDAGCKLVVSPGYLSSIGQACKEAGLPLLPGVSTDSEVMQAQADGHDFLKFFPATAAGGIPMLKALAAR